MTTRPSYINAYLVVVIVILLACSFYFVSENRRLEKELDFTWQVIRYSPTMRNYAEHLDSVVYIPSEASRTLEGLRDADKLIFHRTSRDSVCHENPTRDTVYNTRTIYYDTSTDSLDSVEYEDEYDDDLGHEEKEYDN